MSNEICPTVVISSEITEQNPQGFIIINESDFDSTIHTIYEKVEKSVKATKASKTEDVPSTPWA